MGNPLMPSHLHANEWDVGGGPGGMEVAMKAWSDPLRTKAGTHCVFVRCLRLLPTVCREIKTRFGKLIECTCSARTGGCQDTRMAVSLCRATGCVCFAN